FDILSAEFGKANTYMDLDTIVGGDDFTAVIVDKVSVSDVLVAVIGNRWLTITEENGNRRLDNPRDFVRIEIAKALERGIRVIPVLVAGASMPRGRFTGRLESVMRTSGGGDPRFPFPSGCATVDRCPAYRPPSRPPSAAKYKS